MNARLSGALAAAALTAIGLLPITFVQPPLARSAHGIKERAGVEVVPPASEVRALSLGHEATAVDLLWSKLLIEYGTHWQDKLLFPAAPLYFDAIIALDPKYAPIYHFADTILFYHAGGTPGPADVALTRKYMERGLAELPHDGKLWLQYGQFLAFIAVSVMPKDQFETLRAEGARAMAQGVENGAEITSILSVATLLDGAGARNAALDDLERSYALADDPATREQIAKRIAMLRGSAERDEAERQVKEVEARWKGDFAFLTRGQYMLVSPTPNAAGCAGRERAMAPECAFDWPSALREPTP